MNIKRFRNILKDAEILVSVFEEFTTLKLDVFLEPDEVSIYYKNDTFLLDICVYGEGMYSYYYKDTHEELFADDQPLGILRFDAVLAKITRENTIH